MHVGIDLGTTYSMIAHVDAHGTPVLFPDLREAERFRTPSVVHVGQEGALVGQPAEELAEETPALPVARFTKLKMGSPGPIYRDLLGKDWNAETLSALILKKLARDAQGHSNEAIETLILTVPAHFGDRQRQATWLAARMAGLNIVDLIEEPLAAATHYGAHKANVETTLLVYDLGGGTFDATVLRVSPDGLYALATEGASDLGGKNFDEIIMEYIAEQFRVTHLYDPLTESVAARQLRRHAEQIKIKLSHQGRSEVRTSLFLGGKPLDIVLTRATFQRLAASLIDRTLAVCETALHGAGLSWSRIERVMLAGGSSLVPAVKQRLLQASGKAINAIESNQPHMAVAYGAALIAAHNAGAPAGGSLRLRQRITGCALGFRVIDPKTRHPTVDTIIAKNTPLPVQKAATYYTNRADQKRMVFDVIQVKNAGEQPLSVGSIAFLIDRPRKNYPLEVTLGYDERGLVTVCATDLHTRQKVSRDLTEPSNYQVEPDPEQTGLLQRTRLAE
jgi:molecular chaperone DnaK